MDDQSYDGTEQTPQPKSFRPPPMMMHHPSGIMNVETPQSVITPPMTATRSPPTMVLSSSSFGRQYSFSHRTTAVASLESTYYSDYHPDFISTTTTTTRDATTTVRPLPPSPLLQSSRRRRPHAPSSAAGGSSVVSSSSSSSLSGTLDDHPEDDDESLLGRQQQQAQLVPPPVRTSSSRWFHPPPTPVMSRPPPIDEVRVDPTYHHDGDPLFDGLMDDHDQKKYKVIHNQNNFSHEDDDTLVERTERSLRRVMPTNPRSRASTTGDSTTTTTTTSGGVAARTPRSHGFHIDGHHHHSSWQQRTRHLPLEEEETLSHVLSTTSSYYPHDEPHRPTSRQQQQQQQKPSLLEVSKIQETALQALIRLKHELGKSQERTKELLRQQQEKLENQWQGKQSEWKGQIERLEASLGCAMSSKRELEEQVRQLQEQQKQGEEQRKASVVREQKESLHRKLTTNNRIKELKQCWEDTKKELAELSQRHSQVVQEHSTVVQEKRDLERENSTLKAQLEDAKLKEREDKHANETTPSASQLLQDQLEAKEHEVALLTMTVSHLKESHHQEIEQWKTQSNELTATSEQLKAQSKSTTPRARGNITSRLEDSGGPPPMMMLDSSVSDRLARMRDSAERAHLIKGHKREVARLKMEHEHELQKLQDSHQDALRHVEEESRASLKSQLEELKRVLKQENEELLQKSRGEQRDKCAEMQKEFMQQQEATEQALQKALGKISGLTHQYEREVSHRAGMELSYAQLKHQLEEQRRELQDKYANDLQTQKKEWEFERDKLLTMIQRECNTAFEKNQRRTVPIPNHSSHAPQESPKGVDYDFLPSSSVDPTLRVDTGAKSDSTFWMRTSPSEANVISPMMYSEIDEVLRETEELIRSIS